MRARMRMYKRGEIAKQTQREFYAGFFKKEIIKEQTGNEREGNKEESLRHVALLRLEFQREGIDRIHRDISTLFIELRNLKIKSCHCNHVNETNRENEKNQSIKGFQI